MNYGGFTMNKNIFLLSTFLFVNIQADTPAKNTYGLSEEIHDNLEKKVGPKIFNIVKKYLPKNHSDIEKDVRKNSTKVWLFHRQLVTLDNAHHFAQMKNCDTCPELGELVNQSPELKKVFWKISQAHDALTLRRAEQIVTQEQERKRQAEAAIKIADNNISAAEKTISNLQAQQVEQESAFLSELKAFAENTLLPFVHSNRESFERFVAHSNNTHHDFSPE